MSDIDLDKRKPDGGLAEAIEFLEMTSGDAELLCLLLELRRFREDKPALIERLEAAERERDVLRDQRQMWLDHCKTACDEMDRRDAQEPAMHIYKGSEKHVWIECGKDYPRGRAVYFNAAAPAAALPPEVTGETISDIAGLE